MNFAVITVSDTCHRDNELDKSGKQLIELIKNSQTFGNCSVVYDIVPDEIDHIRNKIAERAAACDVVLTTGGTGLSSRDVTPEATKCLLEKECPGIITALYLKGLEHTPFAALSRLVAGSVKRCLVINLPGNPKALKEVFSVLEDVVPHAVNVLKDQVRATHGTETYEQK